MREASAMLPSAWMMPASLADKATPRYMAPLSRYRKPNSLATSLAKVLFPVEEKPSTAMMISGRVIVCKC